MLVDEIRNGNEMKSASIDPVLIKAQSLQEADRYAELSQ